MRLDPETEMILDWDSEKKKGSRRRPHRKSKIAPSSTNGLDEFSTSVADSTAIDPHSWSILKRPLDSDPAAGESPINSAIPLSSPCSSNPRFRTVDPFLPIDGYARKEKFAPHCSIDSANRAVDSGLAFKALFRVNPHNRTEAYCTIDGVPVDTLINGYAAQNRAVEGDVVAIKVDPPSCWAKMKGPNINTPSSSTCKQDDINSENLNGFSSALDFEEEEDGLKRLCSLVNSLPHKRPTGKVVAIIENSPRRSAVVGYLTCKHSSSPQNFLLFPSNPRFPKLLIPTKNLDESLRTRVASVESLLVAASIEKWSTASEIPVGRISCLFGRGNDFSAQINAILYENSIRSDEFPTECLSSLPDLNWEIPHEELRRRRDLRSSCVFTIDPPSATDLDDALSYEVIEDRIRMGVHIADVSYFVLPETPLDLEAQRRVSSVYFSKGKIPMLPPVLSEHLVSLKPGADRLAFSILWDVNKRGEILDRWIGRTVIRSCCQMSYDQAFSILNKEGTPIQIHGDFNPSFVHNSVQGLHEIAKCLREMRIENGALFLELPKLKFNVDENGVPYDIVSGESERSVFLVEELMLLANTTAAEIISSTFPDRALLRRHPEPNARKLNDLEGFCLKHGFKFDSGNLPKSLNHLQNDDVLLHLASKTLQLAAYFSSGDMKEDPDQWRHSGLAASVYTHFTSPLRRYPDIVVHRTLACVLDAEGMARGSDRCFTGVRFDKEAAESEEGRVLLRAAAVKYGVPEAGSLSEICVKCNERTKAVRNVEESSGRVSTWMVLRRREVMVTWGRVIGVGPRFMSVLLPRMGVERRISYDDVEGMRVDWLENTGTVVLSFGSNRGGRGRSVGDVAMVVNPVANDVVEGDVVAGVMPMTVRPLDLVPVAVHAVGGDFEPLDVGVRLFLSSYFDVGESVRGIKL